ncbi:MAG: hypothetical protein QOE67_1640, partial [Solirubrobacteraceae bacterium]|nr:hypothetical protein [Solirubrobacteraceae bacterium]
WGDRWTWPGARGPVSVVHDECGHDVRVEVRCPHCEREAATAQLRARPRGGVVDPPGRHQPGAVSGQRLLASAQGVALDGGRDAAGASR